MRATPPVTITDARLTSSSAAEPHAPSAYNGATTYGIGDIVLVAADFAIYESLADSNTGNAPGTSPVWWRKIGPTETAYNSGTTYALGDTCSSATYHRVYESLAAGNVGNPLPVPPETTTTKWLDVGPTNKWAMFDLSSNTQTVFDGAMTVVVTPGERVNTLGLTGMKANTLTISATSVLGGGTVYGPLVVDLNTREVFDPYTYSFEPFSTRPSYVVFDIPPYTDIIITVKLEATSGNVKCGSLVVGTYVYVGTISQSGGIANDGLNFSTVTRDVWGNATLVPRRTVPKTDHKLTAKSMYLNRIRAARILLNATPCLWTGLDDSTSDWFDTAVILGIYTQFRINSMDDTSQYANIDLSLEEI